MSQRLDDRPTIVSVPRTGRLIDLPGIEVARAFHSGGGERVRYLYVGLDWSLPIVAFSLMPMMAAIRLVRHKRRRRIGFCGVCGYDLRASCERCPECGTPIP